MSEQSEPEGVVVSMPVSKHTTAVGGSKIVPCDECGTDVYLSPATVESQEKGVYPDTVWCIECAIENDEEGEEDAV